MLSYSDGSEGKSKDSKMAKSSSVDLPIIPFRIMTSEYKSQLEALMMEKFNKLGRGTFGDGTKIYNHGRAKPSLGKVILDLALLGAGEPKDLLALFADESEQNVRILATTITDLLTPAMRHKLHAISVEPGAAVRKDDIVTEYNMKLSTWVKEGSLLSERNVAMYGLIYSHCDSRLKQELDKQEEFAAIKLESDGVGLSLLISKVLSVISTKHVNITKSAAEQHYNRLVCSKSEDIHSFRKTFSEALLQRKAAGLDDIAAADQARHFLDRLDLTRYGECLATLHNDCATDDSAYPKTLEEAYVWASRKVIYKARSSQGSEGAQIVSLGASKADAGNAKKDSKVTCYNCGKLGHYANACKSPKKVEVTDAAASKVSTAAVAKAEDTSKEKKKKKARKKRKPKPSEDMLSSTAIDFGSAFITFTAVHSDTYSAPSVESAEPTATARRSVAQFIWGNARNAAAFDTIDSDEVPALTSGGSESDDDRPPVRASYDTGSHSHQIYNTDDEVLSALVNDDSDLDDDSDKAPPELVSMTNRDLLPALVADDSDSDDDEEDDSDNDEAEMQRLALLAARINRMRALILDSGSEIHLTPNSKLPGLLDVVQVTEASITGVGDKVKVDQQGEFIDIGDMYVSDAAPCTIISLGLALANGSTVVWAADGSSAVLTSKSGVELVFKRIRNLWVCEDTDSLANFIPTDHLAAPATQEEKRLKYNERQLKLSDATGDMLRRLGFPGSKTASALAKFGHVKNIPLTQEGLKIRQDIVGFELAFAKGARNKRSARPVAEIVNEDLLNESRRTHLFVDLFFLNKLVFMLGSAYLPYCSRPLYLQCHMRSKTTATITAAITGFVGILASHNVQVLSIKSDQEPALSAAKSAIESSLKIAVDLSTENVAEAERGIGVVKSVCRRVHAALPFRLFPTLLVFLVAYAVSRLNMWPSAHDPLKLVPRHALTGVACEAKTVLQCGYGDYCVADASTGPTQSNLNVRSVECIALFPVGNSHGDWHCLSLDTFRMLKRSVRPSDIAPMPERVVRLLDAKGSKFSQELSFSTARGVVEEIYDGAIGFSDPTVTDNSSLPRRSDIIMRTDAHNDADSRSADSRSADARSVAPISNPTSITNIEGMHVDDIIAEPTGDTFDHDIVQAGDAYVPPSSAVEHDVPASSVVEHELSERAGAPMEEAIGEPNIDVSHPEPNIDGTSASRTYSRLPRNNPNRRAAVKIDSLQSLGSSSLYTSQRDDDIGKAYSFHMSLARGLRKHGKLGFESLMKELQNIHDTGTIEGVDFSKLTQAQKGRTIRSFLFYKEKYFPDGKFDKLKARLVASGDAQDRSLYTESQTSSPTVSTETLFMVAAIAGREKRKVITVDIGSAFLRGKFQEDSEPIIMRLDKEMADALCRIDPNAYKAFKRHDGSMYVQLKKPLYGLIEAAKLWFDEISRTLKSLGFEQNVYDECCWNRDFKGKQQTIVIHVDDILATCELEEANQQLIDALKSTYEQIGTSVGLVHSYLGMTFDFSIEGRVRVTQEGYVTELVASEDLKRAVKTPATADLFEVDVDSPRLSKSDSEDFHSNTAKLLFLSKRTRPDICVPVSFLTSRVQESTEQDMGKLKRVLRYLLGTKHMGITLEADSQIIRLRCFVDASYGVHRDCKSHTGTVISLGSGPVLVKSVKQKINTKSSTEAELVGLSDSMSTIIWCRNFLEAQGYDMPPAQVFQDNMSTIAMIRSGKPTSDRTRHINIRFFFINDREKSGEVKVEYKSTKSMLADILTKPLQGEQFELLRNELLNIK